MLNSGTAFEIEYQVLEGGDLDIDFQMMSPKGQLLFNELRSEEGLHEIPNAEEGDYKVSTFPVRGFSLGPWIPVKKSTQYF